jgi:molybdate transport system ATP-binding protein
VRIQKQLGRNFRLDIDTESHGCLGILGASGCGKSMTLKCIAGIETPDSGQIIYNGRVLYDSLSGINLKPQERQVGYLFQNYALFPTMNVRNNIQIGIRGKGKERSRVVDKFLSLFQLDGLAHNYPSQLSGGQRQRVALARMFASEPTLILLDEPFSALDTYLREQMQVMIMGILENYTDSVMVTHSRDEAYRLCGSVAILDNGKILAKGGTHELFKNPGHVAIARLTGCKNISPIRRLSSHRLYALAWDLELETADTIENKVTHVGIRAHDLVEEPENGEKVNSVRLGNVRLIEDLFEKTLVFTNANSVNSTEILAKEIWWKVNSGMNDQPVKRVTLPPERLLLLVN